MEAQKQKITALYVRTNQFGIDPSAPNSLSTQKAVLMDYTKKHDFPMIMCYEDEGISGNNFDRPALNEIIKGVKDGSIGTVVVTSISRIGRDMVGVWKIQDMFNENGTRLIAAVDGTDSFDTSWKEALYEKI